MQRAKTGWPVLRKCSSSSLTRRRRQRGLGEALRLEVSIKARNSNRMSGIMDVPLAVRSLIEYKMHPPLHTRRAILHGLKIDEYTMENILIEERRYLWRGTLER